MPRVIITESAVQGLECCRKFLAEKSHLATKRAAQTIGRYFELLEADPEIGRPLPDLPWLRELVIGFGNSGYVALYRYDPENTSVYILAFRHQKEVGF